VKKIKTAPLHIESITAMHRLYNGREPQHPLISVLHFDEVHDAANKFDDGCVLGFYTIAIKRDFKGKIRYGQNYYDFDEGVMSFIAPGQICYEDSTDRPGSGWMLFIHPDFLRGFPLGVNIRKLEFFSYASNEALYLSKKEEATLEQILTNIEQEYSNNIDKFSQEIMISQIETLLTYANRYYHRQFITRKTVNNDVLTKLEGLLDHHFNGEQLVRLPTVQSLAEQLNVSPNYLSDMLRVHTGLNTQQHIHNKLIEKAKDYLSTGSLSIREVGYRLGFEHPQSFNKLFKRKTNFSPLEFRRSFG
jgi:AraC family transcriptional regulator, transcriptional activator of pobA